MNTLVKETITLSLERTKGRFSLCIGNQHFTQNVCEFILTVSFLAGQDIESYLLDPSNESDTVTVPLTSSGRVIRLDLVNFARLRDIYAQQMYLLKLEDVLMRSGVCSNHF